MSAFAAAMPTAMGGAAMHEEATDAQLVTRAKEGDAAAFSSLILRHQRIVYNLAFRFMRNATQAEDMAQEAFLKAFRLLEGFRGDSSFSTWLYRVTCSVCLTELDRRKRRGEVDLQPIHDRAETIRSSHADADEAELIRRCVTKLPEKYAQVLTLYYLQEIPYEDLAKIMGAPQGTLKTWMHRARNCLREIVEKELGEGRRHA
ncbi:MAG TPA: RNA polymerase sigma factor [Candidatus Hydrogenedentes bacterium]|nr:RNA polymerase sigma factor [Candidatus Hydrogenedentota bacterium]HOS03014.1 RNA polymerase sigma factor [Candidatus Hydrogenedentota bacterium]